MIDNKVIMQQAQTALEGRWGVSIGTYLLYLAIIWLVQSVPDPAKIAIILVDAPLSLGLAIYFLNLWRKESIKITQLFNGFQQFSRALISYLLVLLYVLLWGILLIIPGIIAAINYSQVFFILADNKTIRPTEALRKSKEMMNGYRWKYVCLNLRFTGWIILCLLSFGLGFILLAPYMFTSYAGFYEALKSTQNN